MKLKEQLNHYLFLSKGNNYQDNYAYWRFDLDEGENQRLITDNKYFRKFLLIPLSHQKRKTRIFEYLTELGWIYDLLDDEESKNLLVALMAFRILGHKKVKLDTNNPEYWINRERLSKMMDFDDSLDRKWKNLKLFRINLDDLGYPIELYSSVDGVHTQFLLEQYKCFTKDGVIGAEIGDIVIDAGGCYGDTALKFAHDVGDSGHVYSFEFVKSNLDIFKMNESLNPKYNQRITVIDHPLWSEENVNLFVLDNGPGTKVLPMISLPEAYSVKTATIDNLIKEKNINRIDLIKMDIEGAELEALKGAEQSIRSFKPKLAISVYHNLKDFWEIAQWIESLNLDYKFYLRHYTIHCEETVLYASNK